MSFLSATLDGETEPPSKRRRVSYSSLSSASSSSSGDEDEKPLATERAERAEKKSKKSAAPARPSQGKKVGRNAGKSSMKSKGHTAPTSKLPPNDQERAEMTRPVSNGVNGHGIKVKVEDKMDERQLSRLVTGVTVDAGSAPSAVVSQTLARTPTTT